MTYQSSILKALKRATWYVPLLDSIKCRESPCSFNVCGPRQSDIGSSVTPDPYHAYDSQYTSLEATPPNQQINPYASDGAVNTATFFQSQADFTQPVQSPDSTDLQTC